METPIRRLSRNPSMRRMGATICSCAALAALTIAWPLPAQSRELAPIGESGNAFLTRCAKERREPCRAYVAGIIDGLMVAGIKMRANVICPPAGVAVSQVHDIAVAFMRDNPALRHLRTDELIYRAITQAFPCPAKRSRSKAR